MTPKAHTNYYIYIYTHNSGIQVTNVYNLTLDYLLPLVEKGHFSVAQGHCAHASTVNKPSVTQAASPTERHAPAASL